MAPEQWRNEQLDERTDMYAVGCMLFEMLTGQAPFTANTLDELRSLHLHASTPKLTHSDSLSAQINDLILRCLAKKMAERFATVNDLLQELSRVYEWQFSEKPRREARATEMNYEDYTARGITYTLLGRFTEALADHKRAIQIAPGEARLYLNRGDTYNAMGRYQEALADFSRAIEADPTYAGAYSDRGVAYYRLERYHEALLDHAHAIQMDPSDARCYVNRGNTHGEMGRTQDALTDYTRAIETDSTLALGYLNRGLTYGEMHRYDQALSDLNHAIHLDPGAAPAYINRGTIYFQMGRYEECLADCNCALQTDPTLSGAYTTRSKVYARLERIGEAIADAARAIELNPTDAKAHVNMGCILVVRGAFQEASEHFERAAQYNSRTVRQTAAELRQMLPPPRHTGSDWESRGLMMAIVGDQEQALACFNEGLRLSPDSISLLDNKSVALLKLNRLEEALNCLKQVLQLCSTHTLAYHNMGNVLGSLGRYRESLECFEQALRLDPTFAPAQKGRTQAMAFLRQQSRHGAEVRRESQPTLFSCPVCGIRLPIDNLPPVVRIAAGIRVPCPQCGERLTIEFRTKQVTREA
jgi:tetratricopeptide (TPR) repeat protein